MEQIRITLFGKLRDECNGTELIGFNARKVQELLCYLLLYRGRAHHREALANLFWGDTSTTTLRISPRRCRKIRAFATGAYPRDEYWRQTQLRLLSGPNAYYDTRCERSATTGELLNAHCRPSRLCAAIDRLFFCARIIQTASS